MKKLMALLLCAGLLSSSITSAIMSPRRMWQCRPSSPRPDCSEKERAESKKWLVGGIASVIAAILAGLGIAATVSEVKKEQQVAVMPPQVGPTIAQKQTMIENLKAKLVQINTLIQNYSPVTDEQRARLEQAMRNRDTLAQQIMDLEREVAQQAARQAAGV